MLWLLALGRNKKPVTRHADLCDVAGHDHGDDEATTGLTAQDRRLNHPPAKSRTQVQDWTRTW